MDDSTAHLSARGLTCDRGERRVFAHVDFEVRSGGVLAVVGPNGTGKSSLLRLLAGLLPPAGGAITWNGQAVADEPEAHRARLHYVGHLDALKPTLTPAEMLALHAALHGGGGAVADALA
ncbi:MAG: ATP-binding cassette domain-containing protein, partial [Alphaproteobacteria bacterium]|nr:ATP-binding cassette domain-containing protein [Alphaproteobacteria bacterium]